MKRVFDLKKINLKKKNELLPLNKNFDYIKAYHGCKIYKENQFENGLNPLTKQYLIEKILDFKSKLGINIDLEKYDFRDDLNTTEGKIWFCLAEEELLKNCNHYIIYGSEVLHGVLLKYKKTDIVRNFLANEGKACYLECDIPIEIVSTSLLEELEKAIKEDEELSEFAFSIRQKLFKDSIIKIKKPKTLISVLDKKIYTFKDK